MPKDYSIYPKDLNRIAKGGLCSFLKAIGSTVGTRLNVSKPCNGMSNGSPACPTCMFCKFQTGPAVDFKPPGPRGSNRSAAAEFESPLDDMKRMQVPLSYCF